MAERFSWFCILLAAMSAITLRYNCPAVKAIFIFTEMDMFHRF